jgi:O-methyltransferase
MSRLKTWEKSVTIAYRLAMVRGLLLRLKYRNRTMVRYKTYAENIALIEIVLKDESLKDGAIIECGTWRGGMSAGMIEVGGFGRNYYFFDSFEGLPPVKEIDGKMAKEYENSLSAPGCMASLEEFNQTISMTGCPEDKIHIYKGFFESTLPGFNPPKIAVLRLDADWYDSQIICLNKFWDHVLPGGLILIDDYHYWEGCSKAVHEVLAKREASESIRQGLIARVSYIIRKP